MIPHAQDGKWGFRSAANVSLWDAVWDGVRPCGDDLAWVNVGGCAAYDEAEIRDDWMRQWCEGGRWGLVDAERVLIEPTYAWVEDFSEGLAWVNRGAHADPDEDECVARSGRFGFIDPTGRVIVPPTFSTAGDFRKGRARAVQDGRAGHIDLHGKWSPDPA